ncbi:SRPBCC family protein [Couchioplanes caeruleus]|uniref:SRPBCC family protein n=1 Tax=Couchioplanes caeruleus TaxID=56438 RepID=UPI0020BE13F2|nr:SRPBCC family protein [Couchioplanes caeruleus]UQU63459.1 SRPBCC family protein [Couchioplanes caeruleus]
MARFTVPQQVAAPATTVWATMVDWPRHGDWAPLTRVRVTTPRPDGVGAGFVARTGIGPLAFDDPMTVELWQPPGGNAPDDGPGRCEVVKRGRVVLGRAGFSVVPLAGGRSRVDWHEDVTVTPHRVTRMVGPVLSLAGRVGFGATLRAMAKDVERQAR